MSSSSLLPPMTISYLNEVPNWGHTPKPLSAQSKINFATLNWKNFRDTCTQKIGDWAVHFYRTINEEEPTLTKVFPTLDEVFPTYDFVLRKNSKSSVSYEYLIFLFRQSQVENGPVYVLSTSKAYKHIRNSCSDQFPIKCSQHLQESLITILQSSPGQLFGASSHTIVSSLGKDQNKLICRGYKATYCSGLGIEGDDFKIKFKEQGILISRNFSLEGYIKVIEQLAVLENSDNTLFWGIPGITKENLIKVSDPVSLNLHAILCSHLAGIENVNCTFDLKISKRLYASAVKLGISYLEIFAFHEDVPSAKKCVYWMESKNVKINANNIDAYIFRELIPRLPSMLGQKDVLNNAIANRHLSFEYYTSEKQKFKSQSYSIPFVDCIEGSIRVSQDEVFFKIGTAWYQEPNSIVWSS